MNMKLVFQNIGGLTNGMDELKLHKINKKNTLKIVYIKYYQVFLLKLLR